MVRKRSRASRKYYESEEVSTDSDFELDDLPPEPAQKKYSLRQRKRPLFTEDFDYDEDEQEIVPPKAPSDEDFEVEKELALDEAATSEYVDNSTYINHYEPESEDLPEDPDGLIDFEDMIRADIVVNKNRIDYDNVIQKTEIKVQPIEQEEIKKPVKSKRGRKPKARPAGELDSSLLEVGPEVQDDQIEDKTDKDYNPDDDIDYNVPATYVQTELNENDVEELTTSENSAAATKDLSGAEELTGVEIVEGETLMSNLVTERLTATEDLHAHLPDADNLSSSESTNCEKFNINENEHIENRLAENNENINESLPTQERPCKITADVLNENQAKREESPVQSFEIDPHTSSNQKSVIKLNENYVNNLVQISGKVSQMINPEVNYVYNANMEEIIDDDVVVVPDEENKGDVIVLDD